jgi:hypothetical protein
LVERIDDELCSCGIVKDVHLALDTDRRSRVAGDEHQGGFGFAVAAPVGEGARSRRVQQNIRPGGACLTVFARRAAQEGRVQVQFGSVYAINRALSR